VVLRNTIRKNGAWSPEPSPTVGTLFGLEGELQAKLQLTGVERTASGSESAPIDPIIPSKICSREFEVDVVQQIEAFSSELHREPFRDPEVLEH
jgi:hypothetical protein